MAKFPAFFPVTREFVPEKGSLKTASSGGESANSRFGFVCSQRDSSQQEQRVTLVALPRNHAKPLILNKNRRLFRIRFKAPWAAQVTYR